MTAGLRLVFREACWVCCSIDADVAVFHNAPTVAGGTASGTVLLELWSTGVEEGACDGAIVGDSGGAGDGTGAGAEDWAGIGAQEGMGVGAGDGTGVDASDGTGVGVGDGAGVGARDGAEDSAGQDGIIGVSVRVDDVGLSVVSDAAMLVEDSHKWVRT